jgi:hypothetical protein
LAIINLDHRRGPTLEKFTCRNGCTATIDQISDVISDLSQGQ